MDVGKRFYDILNDDEILSARLKSDISRISYLLFNETLRPGRLSSLLPVTVYSSVHVVSPNMAEVLGAVTTATKFFFEVTLQSPLGQV